MTDSQKPTAPAAAAPAAAAPAAAAPVYAAPPPVIFNRLGLVALLVVILSFLIPLGFLIYGAITIATDPNPPVGQDAGWATIGAVVFMLYGAGFSAPVALIGVGLGIASLFRKNHGKVLGIIAIILGVPYGLTCLILLPLAISVSTGG